jgi:hypothetical protein
MVSFAPSTFFGTFVKISSDSLLRLLATSIHTYIVSSYPRESITSTSTCVRYPKIYTGSLRNGAGVHKWNCVDVHAELGDYGIELRQERSCKAGMDNTQGSVGASEKFLNTKIA